jgi:hypothetical protein
MTELQMGSCDKSPSGRLQRAGMRVMYEIIAGLQRGHRKSLTRK